LLQAELQIAEQLVELGLIHIREAGAAAGAQPGARDLEAELLQQVEEPAEVPAQGHPPIVAGHRLDHRSDGSAGCLG